MTKRKDVEKPLGEVTQRIWTIAQQQGFKTPGKLRRRVVELTGPTNADASNWSNMWFGKKKGGKQGWSVPVLVRVAHVLGTRVDDLLCNLPPIPIVAEVSANEDFAYPEHESWPFVGKYGSAINFRWEDKETLKNIYALRVKDSSMLPVYNKGTILYAQKNTQPEEFHDFDKVVYCDPLSNRAQVRQITLGAQEITLLGLNSAIKPITMLRKHLNRCDLIILALHPQG